MSGLEVTAVVRDRSFDVEVTVGPGEVLAVIGSNGAGKSTLLHLIAGLLAPDSGVVRAGERTLTDTARGVHVATHDRRVGLLMQDALLFPHLSVAANVAFGPRSAKRLSRKDSHDRALEWLAEVDAVDFADRTPGQLSGGQAQRVALARALAADPDVILLDEPLAGLDLDVASSVRQVLRRVLTRDGRSAVLVTHDLLDVVTLADRVVVLEAGRIVDSGPTVSLLAAPRSRFGARFAGVNLVCGRATGDGALVTDWGATWYGQPGPSLEAGTSVAAVFTPSAVAVYREKPHGSPRNTVDVEVAELDGTGQTMRVRALEQADGTPGLAADVTAQAAADLRLAPGERVFFSVKAQEVALHPMA
ncbi:sulfate/molybdate ABC transporter ATP-binding protein [Mycolicibacterium arenosum]|uniref:ATP-binding cassette domain-containing protein n=1 Tax=Mycolicibacterium arenosum TaxID=2952157 RepID=A0ABT1M7I4_9MYCO|nr:ATP-binding cassette domain-containing protein [Mycolicibacterium sp. CAU 1645]MCP9275141.1 ATP-binding cassette domain-containing protein [Mycolicibacterium sp. CAU 1645]